MTDHQGIQHLGIIMDGNRRWAANRGLPAVEGHRAGYQTLISLLPAAQEIGIPYLTIYTFSTENWSRAQEEVSGIMKLLKWVVRHKLQDFVASNIRIKWVGSRRNVPADILDAVTSAEQVTAHCTGLVVGLCFNYGGKQEIAEAVQQLLADGVDPDQITPETIGERLYAPELPPLDLIIRTSG